MKKWIFSAVLSVSILSFSHGMDKPGPHGGFVQMPGAFHTEVVPQKDGSLWVYLLDINIAEPSVRDSEVIGWIETPNSKINLDCRLAPPDHYWCRGVNANVVGKLMIKAKRQAAQGNVAIYNFPLKFEPAAGTGHSGKTHEAGKAGSEKSKPVTTPGSKDSKESSPAIQHQH